MEVIKGNENSTLTVKIPRVHLSPTAREEITSRRAIWGTDVYTDDSDVVAACIHAGWIRGEWGDDVDVDLLELYKPATTSKKRSAAPVEQHLEVLTSPPLSGPVHVPADRDLHVTLLILPALEKYGSSTRFGMQSREFGGTYNGRKSIHDGISFMITSVRWVDGAAPQSRLRGKARRERIRKAMSEVNRSQVVDMGEKEILSKMAAASRDIGGAKEKSGGANGNGNGNGNGEGNKENRPATTAVTNGNGNGAVPSPPGQEKRKPSPDSKEKSSEAEGPGAMTAGAAPVPAAGDASEKREVGGAAPVDASA